MADSRRTRQASPSASGDLTWAALEAALGPPCPSEPPAGAIIAEQVAERYGISLSQAQHRLKEAARSGKLQQIQYRPYGQRPRVCYLPVQA
jgi:hypothetical protein